MKRAEMLLFFYKKGVRTAIKCVKTRFIIKEGRDGHDSVIYPDVIFATELLMNYMVLILYCRISAGRYGRLRKAAAVLVSTLFSVCGIIFSIWWKPWNGVCSLALSLAAVFLELLVLQGKGKKLRQYILEMPAMFVSAALLAGVLLLTEMPFHAGTLWKNAVVCTAALSGGLAVIFRRQRGNRPESLKTVRITIAGETYTVTAIIDTGNNLYDRLSGLPVHIAEQKSLLKEEQKKELFEKEPERISFVPYSSLGNPGGLLTVLQAEQMIILDNGKKMELRDQKIGLTDQQLDRSGRWQMLLHPDLESCVHLEQKGGCI